MILGEVAFTMVRTAPGTTVTPVSQHPSPDEQQLCVKLGTHWLSISAARHQQRWGVILHILQSNSLSTGAQTPAAFLQQTPVLGSIRCWEDCVPRVSTQRKAG